MQIWIIIKRQKKIAVNVQFLVNLEGGHMTKAEAQKRYKDYKEFSKSFNKRFVGKVVESNKGGAKEKMYYTNAGIIIEIVKEIDEHTKITTLEGVVNVEGKKTYVNIIDKTAEPHDIGHGWCETTTMGYTDLDMWVKTALGFKVIQATVDWREKHPDTYDSKQICKAVDVLRMSIEEAKAIAEHNEQE